jgi:hypothetical protein
LSLLVSIFFSFPSKGTFRGIYIGCLWLSSWCDMNGINEKLKIIKQCKEIMYTHESWIMTRVNPTSSWYFRCVDYYTFFLFYFHRWRWQYLFICFLTEGSLSKKKKKLRCLRVANESNTNKLICIWFWFEIYFELVWFEIEWQFQTQTIVQNSIR